MTPESPRDVAIENVLIGLNAVTDLVEDLRTQVRKLAEPEQPAETIQCYESCDAQIDGIMNALREGWIDISLDLEGRSWNLLAWCPACQKERAEEECRLNAKTRETPTESSTKPKTPRTLFPQD